MTMAPQDFFPQLAGWVATLDDTFPGAQIKPYFAQWEVVHLLSLAILGGASIILNLRLIGYGLAEERPSEVHRNIRPWLHLGVFGIILTGLLIGASNAERLYTSEAFTAKMLGLAAALFLTYGVSMPVAKTDGRMGTGAWAMGAVGIALTALAVWVFASGKLINPGLWHVLSAAALIVAFVARGAVRLVYLAGLVALIVTQFVVTHFVIPADDFTRLDPANKTFAWIFAAWILGMAGVQLVRGGRGEPIGVGARTFAYAALLVWVMTAAAGRWIAFA